MKWIFADSAVPAWALAAAFLVSSSLVSSGLAQTSLPQTAPVVATTAPPVITAPALTGLALLPGGERVLCVGNELRKLAPGGKTVRRLPLTEPCLDLQVSPSGELALTAGRYSAQIWRLRDGGRVQTLFASALAGRVAFVSDGTLLLGTGRGLEQVTVGGPRTLLRPGAVTGLAVAPGSERLLLGDGQRLQLVQRSDFKVLSGIRCEEACPLRTAQFSADGRGAVAYAGQTLYALREGRPVNVVRRNLTGAVTGFPLPDGGVWVLEGGRAERRDAQTGRREGVLLSGETPAQTVQSAPAAWNGKGGVLLLTGARELLELGADGRETGRQPLEF